MGDNSFAIIINQLKNFKNISIGEQIAYSCIGLGAVLIIVSIILFLIK